MSDPITQPSTEAPPVARRRTTPSILPLSLEGVCFDARGKRLIHDLTFTLDAGPRTIILGPNGAGKSLTLRLCHGLLTPVGGHVAWEGAAPGADPLKHQAMVFQRPVLLRRTVAQNIDYALKLHDVARRDRPALIEDVLNRTGLARFAKSPARHLSGGEQQKLALARAWATKPEVLFLDEPTASLDPAATHAVENIIQTMHGEGTRIVMTTHDLAQARRLADEIMFLHKGHLMEKTPADEFFDAPRSGEAAAFLKGELRW
ncbi:MAG: ATP-binding cassette domain-containing protein [Rhodospirillales bacterium]|nr:ATP-binding cassette domain-containing protein [Rhodospirillales bacterium]MBO6787354.1 ATP-binding cassette domain-containing protein [Rhodospirillales bacterium]